MPQRPTKRERKEDARKRRLEEIRRRQRRAHKRRIFAIATFIGAVVAVILGLLVSQVVASAQRSHARSLAAEAGCGIPLQFPMEGRNHVLTYTGQPGEPPITGLVSVHYKTDPPTSGNHYIVSAVPTIQGQPHPELLAPTSTGIHTTQILDPVEVHNLEHGHVLIQYQPTVPQELVTKLQALARKDPTWVIVAPRANATAKIALTAWTIKQACLNPNDKVVQVAKDFIARFKNHGPESIPGTPVFPTPTPTAPPITAQPTTRVPPKTIVPKKKK
ncbi:MAG: DUF3105 domain-containing protein [Actinomycetota bacterium]